MDKTGLIWWAGLLAVCAAIILFSRRIRRQINESGIETTGVISRITDEGGTDTTDYQYYVRYRTRDGEEIEGILLNPDPDLEEGQQVVLRYHPKYTKNARIVR